MQKNITILGIASGVGAEELGSELGVWDLYYEFPKSLDINFTKILYLDDTSRKLNAIKNWKNLSIETDNFINKNTKKIEHLDKKYLFITGDHSNGFCVWNALLNKYSGDMGLIWMDAHLDAHTSKSSDSKNIHGMPISHLLGYGDTEVAKLNTFPLNPQNLCFIGTRDYEKAEIDFLENLGVKIFFMKDIQNFLENSEKNNMKNIVDEAIEHVSKNTNFFGISIDLDGFDPKSVPATGCFCPNGLNPENIIFALKNIAENPKFAGLEITEFNPKKDQNNKSKNVILNLVKSIFL